ncbi:FtsL-like putative cell division protein [Salibacter halophilus]|jgi:hypothetical protein|uniref:FtsL-like putative cell division protein n=1 Tax=Salibacter halophilus TaxID=1803916 RepID=UPI0016761FB4|nr:FtsL-like putative cell division protein [Salibacter halophilus]
MAEEKEQQKSRRKVMQPVKDLVSGNFLAKDAVVKNLPYMLFLGFLALLYIANGYMAEGTVRDINKVTNELKELRSEYITTKSDLMYTTKQSELIKIIEKRGLGLEESYQPPRKIVVTEEEKEAIGIDE